MRKTVFLASYAAALLCFFHPFAAATVSPVQTPERYWYDGHTKVPLFREPQLDRHRGGAAGPLEARSRAGANPQGDGQGTPVYRSGPDPLSGRRMTQAPGIVFTVADGASAGRAQAWLRAKGLRAEPIAGGIAFKVDAVRAEAALELANALYESGLVQYAQPNWIMDAGPNR